MHGINDFEDDFESEEHDPSDLSVKTFVNSSSKSYTRNAQFASSAKDGQHQANSGFGTDTTMMFAKAKNNHGNTADGGFA